MWGKLQLLGIATSLKILFSSDDCGGHHPDQGEGGCLPCPYLFFSEYCVTGKGKG